MYRPLMASINISELAAARENMAQAMASVAGLQYPLAIQESLTNFSKIIQASSGIDYANLIASARSMQSVFEGLQPSIDLIRENISPMLKEYAELSSRLSHVGYNFSDLVEQAYESIEDEEELDDKSVSKEEVVELIEEQISNPIGFQERLANKSEKFVKKYWLVFLIIYFIWANFYQPYFQDTIGKPVAAYTVSKVKELPEKAGKVIDELKHEVQAIITEDVPYYYKVTYTDEDGNVKEGYVAKKNIQIIETEEETEVEVSEE